MKRNAKPPPPQTVEEKVKHETKRFIKRSIKKVKKLSADELVDDVAINPFLIKAFCLNDFESISKFYVYQRIGRSVVTSFGTALEKIIRIICNGEKFGWWDNKVTVGEICYCMSIKSGPRDMNKDQVERFERHIGEDLKQGQKPMIGMCYGREPLGPMRKVLTDNGLSVEDNTLTGKQLYKLLTGNEDIYKDILKWIDEASQEEFEHESFISVVESKIKEVEQAFKNKYGEDVNKLALGLF